MLSDVFVKLSTVFHLTPRRSHFLYDSVIVFTYLVLNKKIMNKNNGLQCCLFFGQNTKVP